MLQPIQSASLKELFIQKFEKLIFSGYFKIGEKLPPERDLAAKLGVSRPVVHEGLVDLAAKGLVTMTPRRGSVINDFRRHGSLFMLNSLFEYGEGEVSDKLLDSLLDLRRLVETENARQAAMHRTQAHLDALQALLAREAGADPDQAGPMAELDFEFHLLLALASENLVYPLLLNSMKCFYLSISCRFFSDPCVVPQVLGFHAGLVKAVETKDRDEAGRVMDEMLTHGQVHLKRLIAEQGGNNHGDKD